MYLKKKKMDAVDIGFSALVVVATVLGIIFFTLDSSSRTSADIFYYSSLAVIFILYSITRRIVYGSMKPGIIIGNDSLVLLKNGQPLHTLAKKDIQSIKAELFYTRHASFIVITILMEDGVTYEYKPSLEHFREIKNQFAMHKYDVQGADEAVRAKEADVRLDRSARVITIIGIIFLFALGGFFIALSLLGKI